MSPGSNYLQRTSLHKHPPYHVRVGIRAVKICIVCHEEYAGINNTHSFKCYTWRDEENKSESVPAVVKTSSHLRDLSDGWDKNSVSNLLWPQQLLLWREKKKRRQDWIWTMKEKVITCTQSQTGLEKIKKSFKLTKQVLMGCLRA